MRWAAVVLILLLAAPLSAQFDVGVSGHSPWTPFTERNDLEWTGFDPPRGEELFTALAVRRGGSVVAYKDLSGFEVPPGIYEVRPGGRTEILRTINLTNAVFAMVAARNGTIYALFGQRTQELTRLVAIEGSQVRVIADIPFRVGFGSTYPAVTMDLAANQCTLLYPKNFQTVGRFDVCTALPLPDYTIQHRPPGSIVTDVRILPDGGALVVVGSTIRRLNAQGVETRSYPLPALTTSWGLALSGSSMRGLALGRDGRTFLVGFNATNANAGVLEFDLETGALVRERRVLRIRWPQNIVVANGWSAAHGNHQDGADIPSFGVIGAAALVLMLTAAAIWRM